MQVGAGLDLDPSLPQPASLSAVALRHENRYFGVLWAAYKQQHVFTEADISFMTTLASQAALAVANIRLFLAVEASRRQLETVLNSTPDPVLVTDANSRLILANPAAGDLFGILIRKGERQDLHVYPLSIQNALPELDVPMTSHRDVVVAGRVQNGVALRIR